MTLTDIKERVDGKFSCVITFPGGKNAFGGENFSKSYRKIVSAEKLEEYKCLAAKSESEAS